MILQIILKLAGASVASVAQGLKGEIELQPFYDDDTTPVGQIVEGSNTHGEELELLQPDAHSHPLLLGCEGPPRELERRAATVTRNDRIKGRKESIALQVKQHRRDGTAQILSFEGRKCAKARERKSGGNRRCPTQGGEPVGAHTTKD